MTLSLHNPAGLQVGDAIDDRAISILSRREIGASTGAGSLFRHCLKITNGCGGRLVFEDRVALLVDADIKTECNLRKAVKRLARAGLVERLDRPLKGQKCALILNVLAISPSVPQQLLPGFDVDRPSAEQLTVKTADDEYVPGVRTPSSNLLQTEPTYSEKAHASTLNQPVTQIGQGEQDGDEDIEWQDGDIEDDEAPRSTPNDDDLVRGMRFLEKTRRIEDALGFRDSKKVPQQLKHLAPCWAWLHVVGMLSEHELEDTLEYGKNLAQEENHPRPSQPCTGKLKRILLKRPRELLAKYELLDGAGKFQWPRYARMKSDLKKWGVEWQPRWDAKPPPTKSKS